MSETMTRAALKDLSRGLNTESARWLVDYFYAIQDFRIQASSQVRAILQQRDEGDTFELGEWLQAQTTVLEAEIKRSLQWYAEGNEAGRWALSITGIGPVIAAGLLAHIDITQAPTVGHIWRFAGLDPTSKWLKGEKRPWNGRLKVLCWKMGDSFVKVSGNENDIYGKVYRSRKALEVERNDSGVFADQAAAALQERNIRDAKLKKTYEAGRLPDGRIDLRARRYAVKLFLSHFHHVLHEVELGEPPVKPYVMTMSDHAHFIGPPNWPLPEKP